MIGLQTNDSSLNLILNSDNLLFTDIASEEIKCVFVEEAKTVAARLNRQSARGSRQRADTDEGSAREQRPGPAFATTTIPIGFPAKKE